MRLQAGERLTLRGVARGLVTMVSIVVLSACAHADFHEPPETNPTLTTEALAVNQSLDEIGSLLETAQSEDLVMAWSDLDADLRSVVEDLVRDPGSVDMVGMQARVEGFVVQFETTEEMSQVNGQWDELVSRLRRLASRVELSRS